MKVQPEDYDGQGNAEGAQHLLEALGARSSGPESLGNGAKGLKTMRFEPKNAYFRVNLVDDRVLRAAQGLPKHAGDEHGTEDGVDAVLDRGDERSGVVTLLKDRHFKSDFELERLES